MLRIKKVNTAIGKKVYTDNGDYFGEVEEVILSENKIDSWRIRVARDMINQLNGARGVIIPHQFVKAVGDVLIINKASLPIMEDAVAESASSTSGEISDEETVDLSNSNAGMDSE